MWLICSVMRAWIYFLHCDPRRLSIMTRLLPLQATAINSSMCAASWAPISRWRPSNRTWWHGAPGCLNTPCPLPLPTRHVWHYFVWWWIFWSSSCSVYLSSLPRLIKKRNMVKVQRNLSQGQLQSEISGFISHETYRQVTTVLNIL